MRKQRPDLIITDIKMPMMDGYELCRHLRASSSDKLRAVPIIMLSARNADSDRVRGIESGADAYLVKPFVREELTAWVKRLLDSRNAWRNYVNNLENQRVEDESEPDLQIVDTDADDDAVFLKKFRQEVDQQMAQGVKLDLDKIALSFRMGESQLKRKVRRLTGKSMANYITQLRMEKAMQLLKSRPDLRVGDVAEQCGFMDVAYFSRVFRQHYGMTPTVARNGE
jgi:YesN/AraC family two-component response regulator